MLPHSVKMLRHRVQILARCVQILAHFVHILAHFVRILAHCWQMVAHCVKMLARDLGEPLIGHRQDTQSWSMGTHPRSKKDTGTRRTHIAPRTSLIANRTVVFATYSFLSFNKKPRMSS